MGSLLDVADNSGAKAVRCIKVLGGSGKMSANVSEQIVVSVVEALPRAKIKKGGVYQAVIVRTARNTLRSDGSYVKFDGNAAVLLTDNGSMIGSRIFGPVVRELRSKGFAKIVSLAPEVV